MYQEAVLSYVVLYLCIWNWIIQAQVQAQEFPPPFPQRFAGGVAGTKKVRSKYVSTGNSGIHHAVLKRIATSTTAAA